MNLSRNLILPALGAVFALTAAGTAVAAPLDASPASPSASASDPTLYTWHGKEAKVQLPVGAGMIPGAPASFRKFARADLRKTWTTYLDHKPACKKAPTFTVEALRTDGFAFGGAGTYPQPGCQTGGGYEAFWAIRNGQWKQVIGTQDVPKCSRLEKLDFPSEVGVHECVDGENVVPYEHD